MIKDVLQSIEGIEIYPIISLLLFFITFVLMLIKVFNLDKKYLQKMGKLPLDNNIEQDKRNI